MSALDIALGYIDRGWKPVPIPYKKKGPVIEGWQTLLLNDTTAHDHFNGSAQNIGIILGPPSHGLTDVDLDCPEALTVASYLLPITKAMFGRTSKRASHFLYVSDLAATIEKAGIQFQDPNKQTQHKVTLLEVRIGGGGKAAQTVFPGSVHESGEPVAWEHGYDGEPAAVAADGLLKAAKEAAAACLFARYWPGVGARHDAGLCLGGFLYRCGLTIERIKLMAEAVAVAAGADRKHTVRQATDAAESGTKGVNVYGLNHARETFGEAVANKCAEWLGYQSGLQLGILQPGEIPERDAPPISPDQDHRAAYESPGDVDAQPVDLWAELAMPSLPEGALPDVIQNLAQHQATLMGVDPGGMAAAALTVCAAAIPDRIQVQVKEHDDGWTESARLWVGLVGLPSTKKTPLTSVAVRPLENIDAELYRKYENLGVRGSNPFGRASNPQ